MLWEGAIKPPFDLQDKCWSLFQLQHQHSAGDYPTALNGNHFIIVIKLTSTDPRDWPLESCLSLLCLQERQFMKIHHTFGFLLSCTQLWPSLEVFFPLYSWTQIVVLVYIHLKHHYYVAVLTSVKRNTPKKRS